MNKRDVDCYGYSYNFTHSEEWMPRLSKYNRNDGSSYKPVVARNGFRQPVTSKHRKNHPSRMK